MKKKMRLAILMLAGVLVYFAAGEVGMAECIADCWESGGQWCCTTSTCFDYCI
jgi:hypothetical protein